MNRRLLLTFAAAAATSACGTMQRDADAPSTINSPSAIGSRKRRGPALPGLT